MRPNPQIIRQRHDHYYAITDQSGVSKNLSHKCLHTKRNKIHIRSAHKHNKLHQNNTSANIRLQSTIHSVCARYTYQ